MDVLEEPSPTASKFARRASRASIFHAVTAREIRHGRVSLRPHLGSLSSENAGEGSGVLQLDTKAVAAPPLAIAFSKRIGDGHYLAVADEEGHVSILNTRRRLPSRLDSACRTDEVRLQTWLAHSNAIFDICWLQDDTRMLTASGDQTVRLWDVETHKRVTVMKGHSGSVKSVCGHPSQPDLCVSGARDGNIAFWDVRCLSSSPVSSVSPVALIKDAHVIPNHKRSRQKMSVNSITAVLYLKDECLLASAGAADGVLKFWDVRSLKQPVTRSPAQVPNSSGRVHGIAGLSQDPSGTSIIASSTDSRIYMFDVLAAEEGHSKTFSGHVIKSFYIKAAFSPEGSHILSGSTDGNVFIWKVDGPDDEPVILEGHGGEVTAVDWCPTDFCKIATCSDDYTVRVWSANEAQFQLQQPPTHSMRRRVCANPVGTTSSLEASCPNPPTFHVMQEGSRPKENLPCHHKVGTVPGLATDAEEKSPLVALDVNCVNGAEICERKKMRSLKPLSSALSPSALKRQRTIVDYFGGTY